MNRVKLGNAVGESLLYIIMIFTAIITLYPFLNVVAISFNDYLDTVKGGVTIWPRVPTLRNYEHVLKNGLLVVGLRNSILRTVIGTILSLGSTTMLAYVISRKDFILRRVISLAFVITMYVSGGMIPDYLLMLKLKLANTFYVYLIPGLIGAWNLFVIRSYIDGLPESLQESAKIDGANDIIIFAKIIVPLCVPVLATIGLFYAVGQWNSWFDTYIYCGSNDQLTTLQYELMKILSATNVEAMSASLDVEAMKRQAIKISPESIRMAITVVVTTPILLVYPFIQKYFVKGITIGAIKG